MIKPACLLILGILAIVGIFYAAKTSTIVSEMNEQAIELKRSQDACDDPELVQKREQFLQDLKTGKVKLGK